MAQLQAGQNQPNCLSRIRNDLWVVFGYPDHALLNPNLNSTTALKTKATIKPAYATMPFTPVHMGPGILIKGLLQTSFSLMVFGWTQILMDIQPLIVLTTGEGHLHGFSHTYVGGGLIALFAALSGKYLSELGLIILEISTEKPIRIRWWVCLLSAFIGAFSHVLIDSAMHADMQPLLPFTLSNPIQGLIEVSTLHRLCLYSGLVGAAIYYFLNWRVRAWSQWR